MLDDICQTELEPECTDDDEDFGNMDGIDLAVKIFEQSHHDFDVLGDDGTDDDTDVAMLVYGNRAHDIPGSFNLHSKY